MNKKIDFKKYSVRGPGYHWLQNTNHPLQMNSFVKARYSECRKLLTEKLGNLKEKKLADFGCGDGVLTSYLAEKEAKCYGIDLSPEAIGFAQKKHLEIRSMASFQVGSCTDTNYEDDFFDGIICSDVIEHLEEPRKLLIEIRRVLKPKGFAIISTPIRFTEEPLDKMHIYEWYKNEYKELVCSTFQNADFHYSHPVFWYELFTKNRKGRLLVNFLSYFKNPFEYSKNWRFYCLQYAIVTK